jgi:hypothetical protein
MLFAPNGILSLQFGSLWRGVSLSRRKKQVVKEA